MPRDLEALAKESADENMPELTKSPDNIEGRQGPMETEDEMPQGSLFSQMVQKNDKRDELHPYTQTLSPSDLESCVRLEEEAFPPNERATREKVRSFLLPPLQAGRLSQLFDSDMAVAPISCGVCAGFSFGNPFQCARDTSLPALKHQVVACWASCSLLTHQTRNSCTFLFLLTSGKTTSPTLRTTNRSHHIPATHHTTR